MRIIFNFFLFLAFLSTTFGSMLNSVNYRIALKQRNINFLKNQLLSVSNPSSPLWGEYLDRDEILSLVSPEPEDKKPLFNWLNQYNVSYQDHGDSVVCSSNPLVFSKMWNVKPIVKENRLSLNKTPVVPEELQNLVEFISGFYNSVITNKNQKNVNNFWNTYQPDEKYLGKEAIYRLYNIKNVNIKNSSVASIEYQSNGGYSQSDLDSFNKMNNNQVNNVTHNIGVKPYGSDMESQLDVQMEDMVATNAQLWFWDDSGWLYSLASSFFMADDIPEVISMSWGWAEDKQCDITNCGNLTSEQFVDRVNNEYIKIGLRGTTITVSSGDAGAPGRTGEDCDDTRPVNAVMPGSSPWITSVSATFVNASDDVVNWTTPLCKNSGCASGTFEISTNFNWTGWTTGGGFSNYSSRDWAPWQNKAVNAYLNTGLLPSKFNKNGRGYPDVSAIGHNCPVVDGAYLQGVDGTSCSSPIFAGIVTILNDYQKSRGRNVLGFINPLLYQMWEDDPSIFNDVVVGNNYCTEQTCCPTNNDGSSDYGYVATKGWDPVTGLGTPNVGKMLNWLSKH